MGGTNRGRFSISANISMTASLISRAFSLGFILLCIYIKVGDNILNEDVIRVANISDIAGMPLGTAVQCVMFSLIGVFALDLTTGVFGILGSVGKRKTLLKVNSLMSLLMIIIYIVYMVILSIIYGKKSDVLDEISNYSSVYSGAYYDNVYGDWHNYVSDNFRNITRSNFFSQLGCDINTDTLDSCSVVFDEKLSTYLETYLGLITVCLFCQGATIFAAEYTHRKIELKDQRLCISHTKYYLLLTLKLGVFPDIFMSVKQCWIQSKAKIISIAFKVFSVIAGFGLLGLGLAIVGDKFITNSSLQYIFYRIQFHQYYLYDILVCLGASSVIIGVLTIAIQIVGLAGSWRKSSRLLILTVISSSVLHVPRIISVAIIAGLIKSITDTLESQLYLQEQGYYFQNCSNIITKHWNVMLLVLNCCGIWNSSDTINSTYGKIFCCNNARDFLLNPDESYSEYVIGSGNQIHSYDDLEKFGGCGDYKTQVRNISLYS